VTPLEEAEALVTALADLYGETRVRAQQIALARAYWQAVRVRDALRLAVAA